MITHEASKRVPVKNGPKQPRNITYRTISPQTFRVFVICQANFTAEEALPLNPHRIAARTVPPTPQIEPHLTI